VCRIKSALFGGEGPFFATLRGPGRVWLQSLPLSRLANRIIAAAPGLRRGGREEGFILGGRRLLRYLRFSFYVLHSAGFRLAPTGNRTPPSNVSTFIETAQKRAHVTAEAATWKERSPQTARSYLCRMRNAHC